ncbi:MAG TPA: hypothetical protein VFI25_17795 [Planctomycetota bacterium]|jgi:hypothetical protein|nr:hypothetical protein [Planctomycetota bacterium]
MKGVRFGSCFLALLGTGQLASAQAVSLRGKVEDLPGMPNQFVVHGTNTHLTSPTIDLNLFVGQQVLLDGNWNGSATSPSVAVQTIAIAPRTFEIGGNGTIGGEIRFTAFGNAGETALLSIALQPTFLPIGGYGAVFIDLASLIVLGGGPINAIGEFEIAIPIPNDTVFVGLDVFAQGAIFAPSTLLLITNPDWKEILN